MRMRLVLACLGAGTLLLVGIGIHLVFRQPTSSLPFIITPSVRRVLSDRASTRTLDQLEAAGRAVQQSRKMRAAPFGDSTLKDVDARNRHLLDEWGNGLLVAKTPEAIFAVSAGRDKIRGTDDDVIVLVEMTPFGKALEEEDDLTSPSARRRIVSAFYQTVQKSQGYQIAVTEEGVEIRPPHD